MSWLIQMGIPLNNDESPNEQVDSFSVSDGNSE